MQKLFKKIYRVSVSLQVWPNLKWKRLGNEGPAYKMTERNESEWLVGEMEKFWREKAARDSATSHSVKAFQIGKIGNA